MISSGTKSLRIGPSKEFTTSGTSIDRVTGVIVIVWINEGAKLCIVCRIASFIKIKIGPRVTAIRAPVVVVVNVGAELVGGLILIDSNKRTITSRNFNAAGDASAIELVYSVVLRACQKIIGATRVDRAGIKLLQTQIGISICESRSGICRIKNSAVAAHQDLAAVP